MDLPVTKSTRPPLKREGKRLCISKTHSKTHSHARRKVHFNPTVSVRIIGGRRRRKGSDCQEEEDTTEQKKVLWYSLEELKNLKAENFRMIATLNAENVSAEARYDAHCFNGIRCMEASKNAKIRIHLTWLMAIEEQRNQWEERLGQWTSPFHCTSDDEDTTIADKRLAEKLYPITALATIEAQTRGMRLAEHVSLAYQEEESALVEQHCSTPMSTEKRLPVRLLSPTSSKLSWTRRPQ